MASLFKHIFNGSKPENGELTINLNLTIKIEADGTLSVAPTVEKVPDRFEGHGTPKKTNEALMPDFENDGGLINFGKNV